MKNEKLKDCLDDALSGIGENPWLLRQVLARAESEENKPVKKRISLGTVVIAILILALMSVGIAAVSNWNVQDFLSSLDKGDHFIASAVRKDAETENARLHVEAMIHTNHMLSFDWTIENKHPEVPVYCWVEALTVNGERVLAVSDDSESCCGFQETWLPGSVAEPDDDPHDGIIRGEEIFRYYPKAWQEKAPEVYMKVNIYRPVRPVAMIENRDDGSMNQEQVKQKIDEGYYVIPCGRNSGLVPEGYLKYETDDADIGEGWVNYVSGHPLTEDAMGGMTVETLEIRFDAAEQYITSQVRKKAENEEALAGVESAAYTGNELAFDLTLENKHPENYTWFYLEEITVNGKKYDPEGYYRTDDGALRGIVDFNETWLPNWEYPEGIVRRGAYFLLSQEDAKAETAHVTLKVRICRPERPVVLNTLDFNDPTFKEELEKKVADGFYVIPAIMEDGQIEVEEGFYMTEDDPECFPTGWSEAAGGYPEARDGMGSIIQQFLEISFDVKKQETVWETVQLQPQEVYDNEYCTAVFEKAEVTPLGLNLTLRIKPKGDELLTDRACMLRDGKGFNLAGIRYYPSEWDRYAAPGHEGEYIWEYRWNMIRADDLPDTIGLACRLQNGGELVLPIVVRDSGEQ